MAAALLTLCRSARYFIDQIISQLFIILLISFYTSALVQNSLNSAITLPPNPQFSK